MFVMLCPANRLSDKLSRPVSFNTKVFRLQGMSVPWRSASEGKSLSLFGFFSLR